MSENPEEATPKLKAGKSIVDSCPVCKIGFEESMPCNLELECPNPTCMKKFIVMVLN